jgi:hypothetical protein
MTTKVYKLFIYVNKSKAVYQKSPVRSKIANIRNRFNISNCENVCISQLGRLYYSLMYADQYGEP